MRVDINAVTNLLTSFPFLMQISGGNLNTSDLLLALYSFLRQFGLAILIFIVFFIFSRLLRGIVHQFARRRKLPVDITQILLQISEITLMLFGAVTAIGTLGIDVGAIIAGLGLVGFGVGYALKDLISNFIAGLMILLYNPFVRGDYINVTGSEGTVVEVNMRYTVLQSPEGNKVLIPNSSLFTNVVVVTKTGGLTKT